MSLGFRFVFLLSLGVVCLGGAEEYRLAGAVTDTTGAPVVNAIIRLHTRDSAQTFSTSSNDQGQYSLTVPGGEYLLEANAPGLTLPASPRRLRVERSETLPLQLDVKALATTVVVTAAGTPQSGDETSKAVDVVERSEIDRRDLISVVDATREVPGVRVIQRGGPGSLATIQIRGMRTFDTSVLVDGMRFRDVGSTQADASSFLGDLLVAGTSRVEVLRGTGSSLYGSNAMAGVVNIVTDPGGGAFHGSLQTEGGGLGEFRGLAGLGGSALNSRLGYSAGVGHLNVTEGVDGDDRTRDTTGHGLADYALRPGLRLSARVLATDVYTQLNVTPSAAPASGLPATSPVPAIPLSDSQIRLAEQGQPYSIGNATFIPSLDDPDYYRTSQVVSTMLAWQHQVNAPFNYRVSYQSLITDRNTVNGPLGPGFQSPFRTSNQFNGSINSLQARANVAAGAHNLISFGYEFERQFFDSPSYDANPDPAQRINSRTQVSELSSSYDAQDQLRLFHDRLQISLAGRFQHFTLRAPVFSGTFPVYAKVGSLSPPNAYTGDASIAYFVRRTGTKFRSHVGNAYREPSLYERFGTSFYGGAFTAYGDPGLKPERAIAIDAGFDQYFASDRLRLSASYFYTRLQQVILFDFSGLIDPAADPYGRFEGYLNSRGGFARGVELSAQAKPLRSLTMQMSYTYTDARDRLSQYSDGSLLTPAISKSSGSLVVLEQFTPRWDAAFDLFAASNFNFPLSRRRFLFEGPRQAGLSGGYTLPLTERLKLRISARVSNLANQHLYENGFRTPRIWAVGGMKLSF